MMVLLFVPDDVGVVTVVDLCFHCLLCSHCSHGCLIALIVELWSRMSLVFELSCQDQNLVQVNLGVMLKCVAFFVCVLLVVFQCFLFVLSEGLLAV